jgi:plasmid stabilization system protein ParE
MSAYVVTPLAKADIFNIWSHIAGNSEKAADKVERAFTKLARL